MSASVTAPTEAQLAAARTFLSTRPEVARSLSKRGISIEEFAMSGESARATIAEREAFNAQAKR